MCGSTGHAIILGAGSSKQAFAAHSAVLVELVEAPLEGTEWAASFEKEVAKKDVFRVAVNNGVLKVLLMQSLSGTCIATKRRT